MEEAIKLCVAFIKWFCEQMLENPENTAQWGARWMADPNNERLRPLFETPIGTLLFAPKQGDTWGVTKDGTLWSCKRRQDGDVFTLGEHMVGVKKNLTYELHENVIVVRYDEPSAHKVMVFRFNGTTWRSKMLLEGDTIVGVRAEAVVIHTSEGEVVVEDVATGDPRFPLNNSIVDGAEAGEDWLLVWKRQGERLVVQLMTHTSVEEQLVENSGGSPKVFPRFDRDGKFVNVCVTVHTDLDNDVWYYGSKLVVLAHDPSRIVEKALVIDTYSWTLLRKRGIGRPDFGIIAVNGSYRPEFDCANALEVKDGMVCVLCTENTRPRYASDTLVICAPNGKKYAEVLHVNGSQRPDPLGEWPFVRKMLPEYAFAHVEKGCVTVKQVLLPGQANVYRKDQYLFVTGEIIGSGEWMTIGYYGPGPTHTARLISRKPVDITSVVVPQHNKLLAVMQRTPKWVAVIDQDGVQHGLDYTEARDITVDGKFVTFLARNDLTVVRVRVPVV